MKRKLKSAQGETLVEVLAAILIGALSVALLFTAVMASVRMDEAARAVDEAYSAVLSKAEKQETAIADTEGILPADAKVIVKNDAIDKSAGVSVTFYGGGDALSYKLP